MFEIAITRESLFVAACNTSVTWISANPWYACCCMLRSLLPYDPRSDRKTFTVAGNSVHQTCPL